MMIKLSEKILKKKKKKIHQIYTELWPFENMGVLNLSARYLKKHCKARGLKLGQLVDYLVD